MLLTKENSVDISGNKVNNADVGGNPAFLSEAAVSPGRTDISSMENWDKFGVYTTLTVSQRRTEIKTFYDAIASPPPTTNETKIGSKWFVIDKAVRDTVHTSNEQESNAETLVRNIFIGLPEKDIFACRNATKDADKTTIDSIITSLLLPSTRIKTETYIGDGTTSNGVTGAGFQPEYLKIWREKTADLDPVQLFETTKEIMDDNPEGGCIVHLTTGEHQFHTNKIISLDADGFTVDDDELEENPNKLGIRYNYLAIG